MAIKENAIWRVWADYGSKKSAGIIGDYPTPQEAGKNQLEANIISKNNSLGYRARVHPNPNNHREEADRPLSAQRLEEFMENPFRPKGTVGLLRTVEKVQTNAIMFSGGSWLYFPKAALFQATDNGFNIMPAGIYDGMLIYEIQPDDAPVMEASA